MAKDIRDAICDVAEKICDNYCKYPAAVERNFEIDDAAIVLEGICNGCPLLELVEDLNND